MFISCIAFAQPANDDCAGIIDLGEAPFCDETVFFNNIDATASNIGTDNVPSIGGCSGAMENDVWFSFIASDTIEDYSITVTGITDGMGSSAMIQPQVAVYRGDCEFNGLEVLDCERANESLSEVSLILSGLDAGLPYFIRISDWTSTGTANEGTFQLCIEESVVWTPDEDITITSCSGDLYDAGGPDADYTPGLDYTVTIAPSDLPSNGCLEVKIEQYNVEFISDELIITDGSGTTLLNSLEQDIINPFFDIDNSAGVGIPIYSSTGIVDISFQSDATVNLDGFHITWECSSEACPEFEEITIEMLPSDEDEKKELIESLLSTPYAEVTVTEIKCDDLAIGTFETDENTGLGIEKGIVLSSGSIDLIPNQSFIQAGVFTSDNFSDEDLNLISETFGGLESEDACYIEIEVFANTDEINFDYRFGSEEYPEYTADNFNDIFALLISDDGDIINGPINGKENLAVLPDGTPVQVNSVNPDENWQYYSTNYGLGGTPSSSSIVYDGLTSGYLGETPYLTASRNVEPCNTYKLKFAIADRGDQDFDSGVFISEIRGSSPNITGTTNYEDMNYVVESALCNTSGKLTVSVDDIPTNPEVYQFQLTGTADPDLDLILDLPDSIIISSQNSVFEFDFAAIQDTLDEETEYLDVSLMRDYGCGPVEVSTYRILVKDEVDIDFLNIESDSVDVCLGDTLFVESNGAEVYFWSSVNANAMTFNPEDEANTSIVPTETSIAILFGYLANAPQIPECSDVDSIRINVIAPEVEITTDDELGICVGDTITLTATNNVNNNGLTWTPSTFLSSTDQATVAVIPTNDTDQTYIVSVEDQGCVASDTISLTFDELTIPQVIGNQQLCESYPLQLGEDVGETTSTFEWLPNVYLDDNTSPNPTSNPENTITYTLIASSENGVCTDTSKVKIDVLLADIDILAPVEDSLEICLGDTIFVNSELTAGGAGLNWTPDIGLSSNSSANFLMFPDQTTMYRATYTVGPCLAQDSIFVKVDSLPNLEIDELIPFKDPYCQGDTFIIVSNIYQPINFPDLEHQWTSGPGGLTPDSLYNLVCIANQSGDYTRVTTNGACSDTVSTYIEVLPPFLSISPDNPVICPGESIDLMAVGPDTMKSFMWTDPERLSCDTCRVTTAIALTGTETFTLSAVLEGCEDEANVTVFVTEITGPDVQNITTCVGQSVTLNQSGPFDVGASYTWTDIDDNVLGLDDTLTVSPNESTTYFLLMQEGNCSESFEIYVEVINQPPTVSAGDDQIICIGETVELIAEASSEGTFTWLPGNLDGSTINVSPTQDTDYIVEGDFGCFTVEDTVTITVGQGFSIDGINSTLNGTTVTSAFEGENIVLTATLTPDTLDFIYNWIGEGLNPANSNIVSVIAPTVDENNTPFTYTLEVTDQFGCANTFQIELFINDSQFAIPDAFRPGSNVSIGEGENATTPNTEFYIITNPATQIQEFLIFNRWGEQVFEGNLENEFSWDGTFKGNPSPMDVYAYYARLLFNDGTEREVRGEVTLIR